MPLVVVEEELIEVEGIAMLVSVTAYLRRAVELTMLGKVLRVAQVELADSR